MTDSPGYPLREPLHILHLEDRLIDRTLIHDTLEAASLDCDFECAASRSEFEAALHARSYDMIISDYTLPNYDGARALALARKVDPNVPFLFVSGTIGEERAVESIRNGATDYVLKDHLQRLVPAVTRALREAGEMRRRRRAEEGLRATEARFREMAETIRDVFRVSAPDGKHILYVNGACEQVWGIPACDMLSKPGCWLDLVHADDVAGVVAMLQELADGKECRMEYRVVRPDGAIRHVEERCYPIRNAAGHTERVVAVATDCTERTQLQAQLMESQKMEAVGQLAGGIAHDFNNLVTVIKGHIEFLGRLPKLPLPATDSLIQISRAAERAANLTKQLLLFSRKQVSQPRQIDLCARLGDLLGMIRIGLGPRVEISFESPPVPVVVEVDPGMIDQVWMNLAFNARDAMPTGGQLVFSVERVAGGAVSSPRAPAGADGREFARVKVRDSGTGIPPDVISRIFEPFFTTKPIGKGTGLGLSTAFGIVKEHSGWIDVESTIGRGTTFIIHLPLAKVVEEPPGESAPARKQGGDGELILLVEDEAPIRRLVQVILEADGYKVIPAEDGAKALAAWAEHKDEIKMMMTDIVMPGGMTGIDVANRIRVERSWLPVLFTSGYAPEYARERFKFGPDVNFLGKPYETAVIRKTIRQLLDTLKAAGH